MSSVFKPRRTDEAGSGGKILSGRRVAVPATSPYLRSKSPSRSEKSSILSAVFSSAGNLFSSVFGFSPSSSDSGSSSAFDDDDSDDVYKDENDHADDICSKEVEELNQNGMKLASNEDLALGSQPIAEKSQAKLAIEQLLLQETFSRDECFKLTKIIQSRVVDCPTMKESVDVPQQELHDRTVQAYLPGLQHAAIKEAKKWFEEKKMESRSNSEWDHGPCTLNTAMLPDVGEMGSPIDMAKLHMQIRPPWASPSLSSIGFKTPPPIGMNPYKDETAYTKLLKRNSITVGSLDTMDETRKVRLKSTGAMPSSKSSHSQPRSKPSLSQVKKPRFRPDASLSKPGPRSSQAKSRWSPEELKSSAGPKIHPKLK